MNIYIDTSVYNRPFDDQSQPRIWLETQAFIVILQMVEAGEVTVAISSVLGYENSSNPFVERRQWVEHCLSLATTHQQVDDAIRRRALELETSGIKAMDALHIACAEHSQCDHFVTCDDRVVKKYQGPMEALNPVDFVLKRTGSQE